VMFGLGCAYVGDSLAFAIILGLCATLGTAIPMLILSPDDAGKKVGIFTWAGIGIVCIGLYFLAKAGMSKERDQKANRDAAEREPLLNASSINAAEKGALAKAPKSFKVGLVICFVSGIASGLMNVGLTLGEDMTDACLARGASEINKKNLAWALTISSGFVPNAAYSMYLLFTNSTWQNFGKGSLGQRIKNMFLGAMMGVLWYCGNFVYGAGASGIGLLGTVVGWPVFMVAIPPVLLPLAFSLSNPLSSCTQLSSPTLLLLLWSACVGVGGSYIGD
jgi:L-rhamnose-H+ transport protein